jgi:60kDa lysophospholipase
MRPSPEGLVPAKHFLDSGMAPIPSFNDGSNPDPLEAIPSEGDARPMKLKSLRTPLSRYGRRVRYAVLEFENLLDSSSIDAKGWKQIAVTVQRNYALYVYLPILSNFLHHGKFYRTLWAPTNISQSYDAFVILHGTDSLAYTSSALSFMLSDLGKPVILTGSQAPIHELQNDATDNLLGSLIIAGHFLIPEVCLFFNHKLFRGNRATKVSADQFAAFDSPNMPPLATITSSQIRVNWNAINRPKEIKALSLQTNLHLAHVACLRIFPGIKPEMVDAVLRVPGLRGLVLETFGAGNAPSGPDNALINIFTDAVQRGIVIVNVTQCLTGSVSPLYAPAMILGKAGVVAGNDMTTEAALTKLSYSLALPNVDGREVVRLMSIPIRGELSEHSKVAFTSQDDAIFHRHELLGRLAGAIAAGDVMQVRETMSHEPNWLLNESDTDGHTPLHLAATGPNVEVLRLLLQKGASVHLRNKLGNSPLFLAADAGSERHVQLLRQAGAHLHQDEAAMARQLWERAGTAGKRVWEAAGIAMN